MCLARFWKRQEATSISATESTQLHIYMYIHNRHIHKTNTVFLASAFFKEFSVPKWRVLNLVQKGVRVDAFALIILALMWGRTSIFCGGTRNSLSGRDGNAQKSDYRKGLRRSGTMHFLRLQNPFLFQNARNKVLCSPFAILLVLYSHQGWQEGGRVHKLGKPTVMFRKARVQTTIQSYTRKVTNQGLLCALSMLVRAKVCTVWVST